MKQNFRNFPMLISNKIRTEIDQFYAHVFLLPSFDVEFYFNEIAIEKKKNKNRKENTIANE